MIEQQLFEKVGRLTLANEEKDAAYDRLLTLLANVVRGDIAPSRVLVNLTDRSYSWSDPDTRPSTPATINGLPVVVVAPEDRPPVKGGPFLLQDGREITVVGRDWEIAEKPPMPTEPNADRPNQAPE